MKDRHYIHELPSGSYRECTPEELADAAVNQAKYESLKKTFFECDEKLTKLRAECKHPVVYDEPGYIYHSRICISCGNESLL